MDKKVGKIVENVLKSGKEGASSNTSFYKNSMDIPSASAVQNPDNIEIEISVLKDNQNHCVQD